MKYLTRKLVIKEICTKYCTVCLCLIAVKLFFIYPKTPRLGVKYQAFFPARPLFVNTVYKPLIRCFVDNTRGAFYSLLVYFLAPTPHLLTPCLPASPPSLTHSPTHWFNRFQSSVLGWCQHPSKYIPTDCFSQAPAPTIIFDSSTVNDIPTHDPCGKNQDNQFKRCG